MFKKSILILGTVAAIALTASQAQAQSRRAYCDDYARRVAYRQGGDAGNVVGGAVGGAVLGGILGAVTGQGHGSNVATGAAIGGVAGGALGAASTQGHYDQGAYDDAFARCMNQGYRAYDRPVRYDRGVQYCISRYRSYNPDTGLYLSASGRWRRCP
jgi:uncharacterized protein YcfJ